MPRLEPLTVPVQRRRLELRTGKSRDRPEEFFVIFSVAGATFVFALF